MPSSSSNPGAVRIRTRRVRRVRCAGAHLAEAPPAPPASLDEAPGRAGAAAATDPPAAARSARALEAISGALARRARLDREALESLRGRVIDIALQVAARVVRREIDAGRHDVFAIVEETLAHAAAPGDAEVRLHPADEEALRSDGLAAKLRERGVRLTVDRGVARGECAVRSGGGTVERSVAEALEALRRSLETAADGGEGDHAG